MRNFEFKRRWTGLLANPRFVFLRDRFAPQIGFLRARLSPEDYLGLHLTVGALVLIAATWLFGAIAEEVVSSDSLTNVDTQISAWFNAHADATLTRVMLVITNIHAPAGILGMALAFAIYLVRSRRRYWLLTLMLSVPGGMLLNVLLKYAFQRARPSFDNPIITLTTYSFPSGHVMASTVFYGVLAAFLIWVVRNWRLRVLVALTAVSLVATVGFSRVYLGAHYLSDVLGAAAEGLAWLALCLTGVETLRRRRLAMELRRTIQSTGGSAP